VQSGPQPRHLDHSRADAGSIDSPEKKAPTSARSRSDSEQQDTGQPSPKDRRHEVRKFFTRTFAIVGTLLGVLLGAGVLTIAWQGYDRDTELKAMLVAEISTSFARTSMISRSVASGSYSLEEPRKEARSARVQQKYNDGLRAWKEDSARIGAELQAYIESPSLVESWGRFEVIVTSYYQLSRSLPPPGTDERIRNLQSRSGWTKSIKDYINNPKGRVSWDRIESREGGDEFYKDYTQLGRLLLDKQGEISRGILDSSTVYSPTFRSALSQVLNFIRG
jgi:hypothetical protein